MTTDRKSVAIIFSKDRAMQLDACLRTFALSCADAAICQRRVIFKCTDSRHAAQYEMLRAEHSDVEFIAESDFHQDLQAALSGFSYVLFMVDDNLCVHKFRLGEIISLLESETTAIGFSLRLGRNIDLCYSHNDAPQKMPAAVEISPTKTDGAGGAAGYEAKTLRFPWGGAPYDFGYPMEVSSSIFRVRQIQFAISSGERIKHPNGLEERLDAEKGLFAQSHPDLLCYEYSAAFCNPLNVVQFNYLNRSAVELTSSVNSLMERFDLGYRFDVGELAGFQPKSCHQEKEMRFSPPRLEWERIDAALRMNYSGGSLGSAAETASRAFRCTVDARNLADDSLQSVLVALDLVGATPNDPADLWIEGMGKRHREKLAIQQNASARTIEGLKDRLSSTLKLTGEQARANGEMGVALAALQQELTALKPALAAAKFELEQIHRKGWYRFLNDASNRVWSFRNRLLGCAALIKRLCNYKLRDVKSLLRIEQDAEFSDRQFNFPGWLLVHKAPSAAKSEAAASSLPGKPSKGSLASIRSLITLQRCSSGKWMAFARFTEQNNGAQSPATQDLWPKAKPLVSVVISCRNSGASLMKSVNSALAQTWRDLEVVVVDSGSDDADTIRVIEGLRLPRTRVLRQEKLKARSARNIGISAAAGKYICCLDAGGALEPTYIELCVLRLAIEGFGICGSWQGSVGIEAAAAGTGNFDFHAYLESNGMITSTVFPRRLWETAGGIGSKTADHHDGWEFWIRPALRESISDPLSRQWTNGRAVIQTAKKRLRSIMGRIRARFGSGVPSLETQTLRPSQWREVLDRQVNPEKIRVLVCLPFLTIGGAEKILSQICSGLAKQGFHFSVITTRRMYLSQGNSANWFEPATAEIFCLPECLSPESWNGFISYLISSRRVDILWQAGSTFIYDLLPELKTLFPELKVVDNLFNEVGHTANNRKYDYLIDLHIVESAPIKRWLIEHGESEDRIRVIPNGVELSRFLTNERQPAPFDTGGRGFIVGFFGRFSKEKGPDLFVEIAGHLKHEKNILFVMGGHGPMEDAVREQIAERGLEDSVKLLGFCPVETHLSCCDLLVLSSRQDGRPNAVMEAMAMGVPVVASKVGGLAELVLEGYSGYLCDALDTRQFAETISALSHDPDRCEKLRSGAQLHARENFDIRITVAAFSNAFHELLSQRSSTQLVEATAE